MLLLIVNKMKGRQQAPPTQAHVPVEAAVTAIPLNAPVGVAGGVEMQMVQATPDAGKHSIAI